VQGFNPPLRPIKYSTTQQRQLTRRGIICYKAGTLKAIIQEDSSKFCLLMLIFYRCNFQRVFLSTQNTWLRLYAIH